MDLGGKRGAQEWEAEPSGCPGSEGALVDRLWGCLGGHDRVGIPVLAPSSFVPVGFQE